MPNVTFAGVTYACETAIKGYNYIELQDAAGRSICRYDDITNFDAFTNDGAWTAPPAVHSTTATTAVLTSGNIVLTLDPADPVGTGTLVKFNAPCACDQVTGGLVIDGVTYAVVSALGETITGTGGAWCKGAEVAVLLDSASSRAYLQAGGVKSVKVNTTLTAASWSGNVYTISDSNITATCPVELLPREAGGITTEQVEALVYALIVGGTQAAGSIQLVAHGDVPTVDIPVTLIIRRDL